MPDPDIQPSLGVQYLLEDLSRTKFQLAAALDQIKAKDERIAEFERDALKAEHEKQPEEAL